MRLPGKEGRSRAASPSNLGMREGRAGRLTESMRCPAHYRIPLQAGATKSFIECREEEHTTGSEREGGGDKTIEGGDDHCIRQMGVRVDVLQWLSASMCA